jgi:predicted DNA-binding transcriptional regulator AlpA
MGMTLASSDQLLDVGGLATLLGVSERFVRRLVEERHIAFLVAFPRDVTLHRCSSFWWVATTAIR